MELVPAIDLFEGKVVRLHQGDFSKVTRYEVDPIAYANELRGKVSRLHVVDLEGARSGKPTQDAVAAICKAFGEGVQVGGGIRSRAVAEKHFEAGASRVVLGTAAVRDPLMVRDLAKAHPGRVILAVDAKDGFVAIDGWTKASDVTAVDLAKTFGELELDALLYTDVSRDGTRVGPAVEETARLARETGRKVLASGGVGALEHLRALAKTTEIFGVVLGRALLDKVFELHEALAAARS